MPRTIDWYTPEQAKVTWKGAAQLDDDDLQQLLNIAKQQVEAYGETVADDADVPDNFRYAQLQQARNLWNASKVDASAGAMPDGSFVIRPYPLDWVIRQIIRPATAVPWVG